MLTAETPQIPFRGNGPYCYSNTASMLLSTIGEQVSPQEMEAYTGVGLGAFWLPKEKLLFFSSISNPPDLGDLATTIHGVDVIVDEEYPDRWALYLDPDAASAASATTGDTGHIRVPTQP